MSHGAVVKVKSTLTVERVKLAGTGTILRSMKAPPRAWLWLSFSFDKVEEAASIGQIQLW